MLSKINNKCHVILTRNRNRLRTIWVYYKYKKKNKNLTLSLISNNCTGCVLLHEFGLKFNSQFVNLFMNAKDYIKYLENFDVYSNKTALEVKSQSPYPVGRIDDILIHFVHYKSFDEAVTKWEERKKRINKDNIFVIMTEQDGCDYSDLLAFDKLPFVNKVVFTKEHYPNILCSFYCSKYKNKDEVSEFLEFSSKYGIKRRYDCFDWISFFNKK